MSIEDDLRQAVGERQGAAITFTDIDGIGRQTAQKIKGTVAEGTGRIQAPSDVSDLTADELAEEAGISERRARKAIEGGGGDPDRKPRSNTGSVSAAGIKVPTGEFRTEISDKDKAEARFSSSLNRGIGRSQNAAIADKSKRAPVTTDVERWKDNKGELDFPGVDTPTDSPDVRPKDLRQEQRPATTDPSQSAAARATVPETPSTERNTEVPLPFTTDLGQRDVSLAPEEAFEGVGAGSAETTRQDPNSGFAAGLASGEEADISFVQAERERSSGDTPAGVARRESERQAAKSDRDTAGLRGLDSRIRAARGDELDTSDAEFGGEELTELNNLFGGGDR